jgi:hypothetical protein
MTGYQRVTREQGERGPARGQRNKTHQRKSIAGGRWRSGPHKTGDRTREGDRTDEYDRDELDESPDYLAGPQAVLSNPAGLDT